jgi:proliferating cell nuclear antigen
MFEARLLQGSLLKKIIEAIRELVGDVNIDCDENGLKLQAMDSSHVSLCALTMRSDGFDHYRCDKPKSLGINTLNLSKILKCAGNEDVITLKAEEGVDSLSMVFDAPNQEKISEFDLKLMDIDAEHLGIPDTSYKCNVRMPSAEFQRIIRDLGVLGDTCTITVTKEGIRFSTNGDLGRGNIMLKQHTSVDKEEDAVVIDMQEPVELNFALRYLTLFTKGTSLGPTVCVSMSPDVPIVVQYPIENMGSVSFYLAPKIDEDA